MKGLQELVTEINYLEKSEDVGSKKGGIWTSGEDACIYKGLPPFNHNLEYGEILLSENGDKVPKHKGMKVKEMYISGIHREIYSWLEERGWYPKWQDAGTLFFWKNTGIHETDALKDIHNHPSGDDNGIEEGILKSLKGQFRNEKEGKRNQND
jgi:hypothetical protein